MGVMGVVVDGCEEPLVGTIGMIGTGAACELVSWSFAGSGVSGVVEAPGTVETLETGAVCESGSWSCSGSGAAGLVRTIGSGGSGGFFCAEGSCCSPGTGATLGTGVCGGVACSGSLETLATVGTGVSASGVLVGASACCSRQG